MDEEKRQKYLERRRAYYQNNRDKILEQNKQSKRWRTYYEKHKEEIQTKNLDRYYIQKAFIEAEEKYE